MRDDEILDASPDKSPHERFTELAEKLMAVPKSEVDEQEARWQASRPKKRVPRKKR
jgi:hypothetical protein